MADRVVIGVGNALRGDDGAGLAVVEALERAGAQAELVRSDGNPTGLMAAWGRAADVVVVDAVAGGAAGAVQRWDAAAGPVPAARFRTTHTVGPAEAIELARALGELPGRLTVVGITGARFAVGAPMSEPVARAVAAVAAELADA